MESSSFLCRCLIPEVRRENPKNWEEGVSGMEEEKIELKRKKEVEEEIGRSGNRSRID